MNTEKKIAEIKSVIQDISEKLEAIAPAKHIIDKEKLKELEQLSQILYKNILSLSLLEEFRSSLNNINQSKTEEDEFLPNQLEINLFEEAQESVFVPATEPIPTPVTLPPIQATTSPSAPMNIGLNDKFRFIRELFEDSTQEYTIAINQLNNIARKEEAYIYLESLKNIYHWKDDNECYISFLAIVNRRYN